MQLTVLLPFFENKKNSSHEKAKPDEVIPGQFFFFEKYQSKSDKNDQRDGFLDGLQLDQRKRSSFFPEPDPVGRYLEEVFKKCKSPADENDAEQAQAFAPGVILESQVTIPGQGHE